MNILRRLFGGGTPSAQAGPDALTEAAPASKASQSRKPSARVLGQLLKDLQDKTPSRKAAAIMSISVLDQSAYEPLLKELRGSGDRNAKLAAAEALGILGNADAVEPLCAVLKESQDSFLFGNIAHALGRLADQSAVETLIPLLRNFSILAPKSDPNDPFGFRDYNRHRQMTVFIHGYTVRRALAEALGTLRDERALEVLLQTLKDDEFYVVGAGAEALAGMSEAGLDALIGEIKGLADSKSIHWLVWALEKSQLGERQVRALIAMLEDGSLSDEIRRGMADVLAVAADRSGAPPLLNALKEKSSKLRAGAALALGKIGDPIAFEPLMNVLHDPDADVRKSGCDALGRLGDARAVDALAGLLTDANEDIRMSAAFALARFRDSRVFEHLLICLKGAKDKSQRGRAAAALAQLGDEQAIGPLSNLLSEKEESLRLEAIKALSEFQSERVTASIASCLNDSEPEVRVTAAESLARRGDGRGFDVMLATLLTGTLDHHQLPTIRGLGALRDSRAVAPLVLCLRGSRGQVRRAIISALEMLGAPAKEALKPLLEDPRPLVSNDAQMVWNRITADGGEGQVA
jgi:HEAT repeat protein